MSCKGFKAQFLRRDFCRLCFKARDEHKTAEQLEAEKLATVVAEETAKEHKEAAEKAMQLKKKQLRDRELSMLSKHTPKPQDDEMLADESLDSTFTNSSDTSDDDMVYESVNGILADAQAALQGAMDHAMETRAVDVNDLDLDVDGLSSLTYTEGDIDTSNVLAKPLDAVSYSSTENVHSFKMSNITDTEKPNDGTPAAGSQKSAGGGSSYTSSIISSEGDSDLSASLSSEKKDLAAKRLATVDAILAEGDVMDDVDAESSSDFTEEESDELLEGSEAEKEFLTEKKVAVEEVRVAEKPIIQRAESQEDSSFVSSIESSIISSKEDETSPVKKEESSAAVPGFESPTPVVATGSQKPAKVAQNESSESSSEGEWESSYETETEESKDHQDEDEDAPVDLVELVKDCLRATKRLVTAHSNDDFGTLTDEFENKCSELVEILVARQSKDAAKAVDAQIELTIKACSAVLGNPSEENLDRKEKHAGEMSDALRSVLDPNFSKSHPTPPIDAETRNPAVTGSESPGVEVPQRSKHISVQSAADAIKQCLKSTTDMVTARTQERLDGTDRQFIADCAHVVAVLRNRANLEQDEKLKVEFEEVADVVYRESSRTLESCRAVLRDSSDSYLDQRDEHAHAVSEALRRGGRALAEVQQSHLRRTPIQDHARLIHSKEDSHFFGVVHFKDKDAASELAKLIDLFIAQSDSIHDVSYSSENLPQELQTTVADIVLLLHHFVDNAKTDAGAKQSKDCIAQIKKRQKRLNFVISEYRPSDPWTDRQKYVITVSLKAILGNLKTLMNISERETVEFILSHITQCLKSTKGIVTAKSERDFAPLADNFTHDCLLLNRMLDHRTKVMRDEKLKTQVRSINEKIRSEIEPTVQSCEVVIDDVTEDTLDTRDDHIHAMSGALREAMKISGQTIDAVADFVFLHEDSDQSISLVTSEESTSAPASEADVHDEDPSTVSSDGDEDSSTSEQEREKEKGRQLAEVEANQTESDDPLPENVNPLVGVIANPQAKPYCLDMEDIQMICRCGQSKTFPICDGSHVAYNAEHGTEYSPWEADPAILGSIVYICGCGESERRTEAGVPLCDGTHSSLPETHRARQPKPAPVSKKKKKTRDAGFSDRGSEVISSTPAAADSAPPIFSMSGKIRNPSSKPHAVDLTDKSATYICRCGQSERFPLCDGSHGAYNEEHGTLFSPWYADPVTLGEDVIHVCGCGESKKRIQGIPLCDGTHKTLPGYASSEELEVDDSVLSDETHTVKDEEFENVSALIPKLPKFGVHRKSAALSEKEVAEIAAAAKVNEANEKKKSPKMPSFLQEKPPAPPESTSDSSEDSYETSSGDSTTRSIEKAVVVAVEKKPQKSPRPQQHPPKAKSPRRPKPAVQRAPLKERQKFQTATVYKAPKRAADAHTLPASRAIVDELFESSEDDVYVAEDIRNKLARLEERPSGVEGSQAPLRVETLYCSKWDPGSAAVRYVLYKKRLAVKVKFVESGARVLDSPWDTLPCFVTESGAALTSPTVIISFLLDKYKAVRPKMQSRVSENRFKSLMVANICEQKLDSLFYLYPSPSLGKLHGRRRPSMHSKQKQRIFQDHLRCLDNLETFVSSKGPYVAGKVLGVGDVVMLPYFLYYTEYMRRLSKVVFDGRPRLKRWWDHIQKEDCARRVIEEINRCVFEKAKIAAERK